jgi:uncharacterized membrane protein
MPDFISISNNDTPDAERWTSRMLRLGVWVSASLMIAGLILAALYPSAITTYSVNPSLGDLFLHIFSHSFDPVTLMFTGLVCLMFTPVLRVVVAIAGFAKERDWRFVFVSSTVLLLLVGEIVYSIFIKG